MMTTTINGVQRTLDPGTTLARLLRELGVREPGIAVAVNDDVVPRSRFDEHELREGDAIEIIRAVAGG